MRRHPMFRNIGWAFVLPGLLLGLSGCSLFGSGKLPMGNPKKEWRAAWVVIEDDVQDEAGAKQIVQEARELGLNTIYLAAYRYGQAYYPSLYAPIFIPQGALSPLTFDPIEVITEEAHAKGKSHIQVYAWISLCQAWDSRDRVPAGHPVNQFPQILSRYYDPNRPPEEVRQEWFDPGVPAIHDFAANLAAEITDKYNVDGLLIDSVQYRGLGFGYNAVALQRFAQETGRQDVPPPEDPQWLQWRSRQVSHIVERMAFAARAKNPSLPIAVCASAEGPFTASYKESQPYMAAGQDWPMWMREGLADVLVLQSFKRQSNAQQSKEFTDWLTFAQLNRSGKALVAGLAARDNTLLATQNQIETARALGVQGVAIMSFRANNSEGRPRRALFDHLLMTSFSAKARAPQMRWLTSKYKTIVSGFVRTAQGAPVPNLRVFFPALKREVFTHPNGMFILFDAPVGVPLRPGALWQDKLYETSQPVIGQPGIIAVCDLPVGAPSSGSAAKILEK